MSVSATNSCLVARAWTHGVPSALAEKVGKAEQAATAINDTATLTTLGRMEKFAESNCTDRLSDLALNAAVGLAIGVGAHLLMAGPIGSIVGFVGMGVAMPTLNKKIQEDRLSCFADKVLAQPAPQPAPAPAPAPQPAPAQP